MMGPSQQKILLIEDKPSEGSVIKDVLGGAGYQQVDLCSHVDTVMTQFRSQNYSLVLMDHDFCGQHGFELMEQILAIKPDIPIVYITEKEKIEWVIEAMQRGCLDVLEKPLQAEKILLVLEKILQSSSERTEVVHFKKEKYLLDESYHGMVGRSLVMKKIFNLIERIKESSVNILITGPSGSGKEMIAKALHETSPRAANKFVAINCSAIPETLLEEELFGHKKGAYTDATTDKIGLFQEAAGGTLFLDEIGDMPLNIQPKILRAIQEREIRPLGGVQSIKIDVRIITATNQNLHDQLEKKNFREDLYYRLNSMQIEVPPLKNRREDIPLLVDYFLDHYLQVHHHSIKGISQKAMKLIIDYSWPGNVRELENVLERAVLLAKSHLILPEDLLFSEEEKPLPTTEWAKKRKTLEAVEKSYILEVLSSVGGNRSVTAHILGIGRKTLYNKLARYRI